MLVVFPKTANVETNDLIRLNMQHDDHVSFSYHSDYVPGEEQGFARGGRRNSKSNSERSRLARLVSSGYNIPDIPGMVVVCGSQPYASDKFLVPFKSATFQISNDNPSSWRGMDSDRLQTSVKWDDDSKKWTTKAGLGEIVQLDKIDYVTKRGNWHHGKVVGVRSLIAALLTTDLKLPVEYLTQNVENIDISFVSAEDAEARRGGPWHSRFNDRHNEGGEHFVRLDAQWYVVKHAGDKVKNITPIDVDGIEVIDGRVTFPEKITGEIFNIKTLSELNARADVIVSLDTSGWHNPNEKDIKSLARGSSRRWGSLNIYIPLQGERYTEQAALETFTRLGIEHVDNYDELTFTSYGTVDGSSVVAGKHDFGIAKTMGLFFTEDFIDIVSKGEKDSRRHFGRGVDSFKKNLLTVDPSGMSEYDIKRICADWRIRTILNAVVKNPDNIKDLTADKLNDMMDEMGELEGDIFDWDGAPINDEATTKIIEALKGITEQRVIHLPLVTPRIAEEASNQLANIFERRVAVDIIRDGTMSFKTIAAL